MGACSAGEKRIFERTCGDHSPEVCVSESERQRQSQEGVSVCSRDRDRVCVFERQRLSEEGMSVSSRARAQASFVSMRWSVSSVRVGLFCQCA